MENPIKMDDLGEPQFLETPRWLFVRGSEVSGMVSNIQGFTHGDLDLNSNFIHETQKQDIIISWLGVIYRK